MIRRKAPFIPRCWVMCDARLGHALPRIIAHMPPRSAVVVRPHAMPRSGQTPMIQKIRHIARARRHLLLLAGPGRALGYDGRHGLFGKRAGAPFLSVAVHTVREARLARSAKANVVLISPIWPTRSHVNAPGIGHVRLDQLGQLSRCAVIALGGMDAKRFRAARRFGACGWAGIDAWANAVDG